MLRWLGEDPHTPGKQIIKGARQDSNAAQQRMRENEMNRYGGPRDTSPDTQTGLIAPRGKWRACQDDRRREGMQCKAWRGINGRDMDVRISLDRVKEAVLVLF
ncbi:hypothetical protein GB937_003436 [Aspergillus fischeri]|nr:hypothetical protein GB937_003436 [Aspergillus fischeri]